MIRQESISWDADEAEQSRAGKSRSKLKNRPGPDCVVCDWRAQGAVREI